MSFTEDMLRTLLASCCTYERSGCVALYFYRLPSFVFKHPLHAMLGYHSRSIICSSFLPLGKESSELPKGTLCT